MNLNLYNVNNLDAESFFENLYKEVVSKECNDEYWLNQYSKLPLEQRCRLWWIEIARFEHRIHGEFNTSSIEDKVELISVILLKRDKEYVKVISVLIEHLTNNGLQVSEISDYMALKFKDYIA
jgi:hypothetical protein